MGHEQEQYLFLSVANLAQANCPQEAQASQLTLLSAAFVRIVEDPAVSLASGAAAHISAEILEHCYAQLLASAGILELVL